MIFMKRFWSVVFLFVVCLVDSHSQSTARQDSLIYLGRVWREARNYNMAIDQFLRAGGDEAEYEIALTHYNMGKVSTALSESKAIVERDNAFSLDANLLIGLCRERQGFERAAKRIYKKLAEKGSAMAAYYYASMMQRKGHLDEAEKMCQRSILIDNGIPEAHYLLSVIEVQKSERYKAMMSLYFYLLINNDENNQRMAYSNLIRLWRRSAKALEIIKTDKKSDKMTAAIEKHIDGLATSDSISNLEGREQIEALIKDTDSLMRFLLSSTEDNLDFWQIAYADFFVKMVPRNFIKPYVYYISDASHHAEVLDYVAQDEYLFNEFRLWMEAQE